MQPDPLSMYHIAFVSCFLFMSISISMHIIHPTYETGRTKQARQGILIYNSS